MPLAGWSVAVKDVIDVAGLPTRCNSPLSSDAPATADAVMDLRRRLSSSHADPRAAAFKTTNLHDW
jgi:hypothetical protein